MRKSIGALCALSFLLSGLLLTGCPTDDSDGSDGGGVTDGGGNPDGGGCSSDLDCPGGTCDLLTGQCSVFDGGTGDGGDTDGGDGGAGICTPNEARCNADGLTLELCATDGTRWRSAPCPSQVPACHAGECVVCAPGLGECQSETALTCRADGSGWDTEDCAATGGSCNAGVCLLCAAGATRCADTATLQTCNSTGTAWLDSDCGNDICDAGSGLCIPVNCTAGVQGCQGDRLVECNATGDGFDLVTDCAAAGATCRVDQCVDLCAEAVQNDSYIGCEYWPVVLSNSALADLFRADFAVVLANPNAGTTADIEVFAPGNATPVVTAQVLGGTLETIRLPWNAMDAVTAGASVSARGAIAYRLVSSVPVTAYQFNPLASNIPSGCTQDTDCASYDGFTPGTGCLAGPAPRSCGYDDYSYTNDASLLLPAHILGDATTGTSGYMAVSPPHEFTSQLLGASNDQPAYVAIVGTQDATTVTFVSAGATAAGGGLATLDPGGQTTITLDAGEVVQIASRQYGTPEETSDFLSGLTFRRFPEADLTGSVITSDKPIAVYSGADCQYVPYNTQACDHLEQQLFPFSKWGTSYVAGRSEYPNNTTVGDVWRVVAGADATQVTVTPASVQAPVTLNRGEFIEITTTSDFVVQSQDLDHPIMVAQFFVGIQAALPLGADPTDKSNVGDPSMVLAIPTEQFRDAYTFTTPDTIARDFVTVVRPTGATVTLGAVPMNTTWSPIAGTGWEIGRLEIPDGTHRLQADQPVGLSVYGFDWSVSYGYPGGLDLRSIVVINPGG